MCSAQGLELEMVAIIAVIEKRRLRCALLDRCFRVMTMSKIGGIFTFEENNEHRNRSGKPQGLRWSVHTWPHSS